MFILHRFLREQKGAAVILAALAITALMGAAALVLDLGLAYLESLRLQNAVDSAVLAAVQDMPPKPNKLDKVKDKAIEYAAQNGVAISRDDVTFTNYINNEWMGIRVTANRRVNFSFSGILGINSANVTKSAEAVVGALESAVGVIPLSIGADAIQYGAVYDVYEIKGQDSATEYSPGWRGIVDLDTVRGGGASDYYDRLLNGYNVPETKTEDGDYIPFPIDPGVISNKTLEAVNARVNGCEHGQCGGCCTEIAGYNHPKCTGQHYILGCPRVVLVPVLIPGGSSKEVYIDGFAVLVLEEVVTAQGGAQVVRGTFVKQVMPGDPELTATVHNYGALGVRLVQ